MRTLLIFLSFLAMASCTNSKPLAFPPEVTLRNACLEVQAKLVNMYRYNNVMSGETKSYLRVIRGSIITLCGEYRDLSVSLEDAEENVELLILDLIEEERKVEALIDTMRFD